MPEKKERMVKTCPKCSIQHKSKGTYCTRKCANSRSFTKESREKTSDSMKRYIDSLSEEEKQFNFYSFGV